MPWLGRTKDEPKPPPIVAAVEAPEAPKEARPPGPGAAAKPKDEDVTDRVVAVVNNDAITLGELQEAITAYRYQTRQEAPASDEFVQQFLTKMIENRLQVQEAEREKIAVDEAEVEEELTERIKKLEVRSREEFEKLLKAQGLTMEAIKKRVRDELRVARVINRKVRLRISVTEAEITKYVEANRQKLEGEGLVRAKAQIREILFREKYEARLEAWLKEIKQRAVIEVRL